MSIAVVDTIRFCLQFLGQLIFIVKHRRLLCNFVQNTVHIFLGRSVACAGIIVVVCHTGVTAFINAVGLLKLDASTILGKHLLYGIFGFIHSIWIMLKLTFDRLSVSLGKHSAACNLGSEKIRKSVGCFIIVRSILFLLTVFLNQLLDILPKLQHKHIGGIIPHAAVVIIDGVVEHGYALNELVKVFSPVFRQVVDVTAAAVLQDQITHDGESHVIVRNLLGKRFHQLHHTDTVEENSAAEIARKSIAHSGFDIDVLQNVIKIQGGGQYGVNCSIVFVRNELFQLIQCHLFVIQIASGFIRIESACFEGLAVGFVHGEVGE